MVTKQLDEEIYFYLHSYYMSKIVPGYAIYYPKLPKKEVKSNVS